MRVLDMHTFLVLARNRHFARTAEELNATQPAISTRLATLEREFGCRLIERGGEFRLTPQGKMVFETFQAVVEKLDALRADLAEGSDTAHRTVRIGAIDSVVSTWMPHLIEALHDKLPTLKIELTVEGTKLLAQGMTRGEFDLIFAVDPAVGEGFRSYVSCIMQMVWAGSSRVINPDRLYEVDDLAQMPIITFPKDTPPYRQIAPYFHDERVLASKLTSSNSLFAIINLLIDGFGVGAIPTVTIQRELKMGLLHPIRVAKRFPPLPVIATYQSQTNHELIQLVVQQSRISAQHYCGMVEPGIIWTD